MKYLVLLSFLCFQAYAQEEKSISSEDFHQAYYNSLNQQINIKAGQTADLTMKSEDLSTKVACITEVEVEMVVVKVDRDAGHLYLYVSSTDKTPDNPYCPPAEDLSVKKILRKDIQGPDYSDLIEDPELFSFYHMNNSSLYGARASVEEQGVRTDIHLQFDLNHPVVFNPALMEINVSLLDTSLGSVVLKNENNADKDLQSLRGKLESIITCIEIGEETLCDEIPSDNTYLLD